MLPEIAKILEEPYHPEDVAELTTEVKRLLEMSRSHMINYYDEWDMYYSAYQADETVSSQDNSSKKNEPGKIPIPVIYAQIETFKAFSYQLLTQRPYFFELIASGIEDEAAASVGSQILERDLDLSNFYGKVLLQFLRDVALFNMAILKHSWVEESSVEEKIVQVPMPDGSFMEQFQKVEVVQNQFNKIVNVSPFQFFPDPRLPLSRFKEGEFCADETYFSHHTIKSFAVQGLVAGLEHVNSLKSSSFSRQRFFKGTMDSQMQPFILTEIQLVRDPESFTIGGKKFFSGKKPKKFLIWLLNNDRIVRINELNYGHNEFTYDVGLYHYDDNVFLSFGLAEMLYKLQDTMTYFLNSRISSVRNVISNRLVVDPKMIEMDDLKNRRWVIRTKPAFQGLGLDRGIRQLPVADVTGNHVQDIQILNSYVQHTSGISENLLGQFSPGRRSAAEARAVNSNGAARIRMIVQGLWENCLKPMAKCLLENHRVALTPEMLSKIIGEMNLKLHPDKLSFLLRDRNALYGNYDFTMFQGSLPSEKITQATILQGYTEQLVKSPDAAKFINIPKLQIEILELLGIKNAERFFNDPGIVSSAPAENQGMVEPPNNPGANAPVY